MLNFAPPNFGSLNSGTPAAWNQSPVGFLGPGAQTFSPQSLSFLFALMQQLITALGSGGGLAPSSPAFGQADPSANGAFSPTSFLGGASGGPRRAPRRRRRRVAGGGGGNGGGGGSSPAPRSSGGSSASSGDAKGAGKGWVNPVGGKYTITSGFGSRKPPTSSSGNFHGGTDMAGAANTPIRAAKGGVVKVSRDMTTSYGKWIEIQHDDGTRSRYAHMNKRLVQVGDRVEAGQQIGKMGSTGNSTGNHLHFEVLDKNGKQVDTSKLMKL